VTVAYILLGWLMTVASCLSLGLLAARILRYQVTWPMAFLLGGCLLSPLVLACALLGAVYKGVFLALALVLTVAAGMTRSGQMLRALEKPPRWFWLAFVPFTLLYFTNALAPEMSPDGMAYHLGLVAKYAREHRMTPVPWNMYASLSQGVEMLFLFAFPFGRHSAAALVHFTYLVALPWLMIDFAARRGWPVAGAAAAVMVYASPVVGIDGISAYVDVALAALWFGLFVLLEEFLEDRRDSLAPAIGMVAGFCFAAKYTAALATVYALFRLRARPRAMAAVAAIAGLMALPWLLRNWMWMQNPVAPLFNAWFENPYVTVGFEREYSAFLRTYDVKEFTEWLRGTFVTGEKVGGFLGPVTLLALLGAAEWTWLFPAATYPLNIGARFLIPVLPFLALGMGKALSRWPAALVLIAAAQAVSGWPYFYGRYASPATWFMEKIRWKQALRIESEDSFLNFKRAEYRGARLIEDFVPAGERAYTFSPVAESYTTRDVLAGRNSAEASRVRELLLTPFVDYLWPTWRLDVWFEGREFQRLRLIQTESGPAEQWALAEVIVPGARVVRANSSHFPFHLDWAFDGNRYTRWDSGRPLHAGMWFEAQLDRPVYTGGLTIYQTRDQWASKLAVETWDGTSWKPVDKLQVFSDEERPPASQPRWAMERVRQSGIRYLLIRRDDFGFDRYAAEADSLNLALVAERQPYRLYRLK
jgi:hypothetical protein